MSQQHTHFSNPFSKRKNKIIVLCDGVSGPANLGGLFRLCDAFGVEKLIVANTTLDIEAPRLRKTARDTQRVVAFETAATVLSKIGQLRAEGYRIIGLEITSLSAPIQRFNASEFEKLTLVVGSEKHGISEPVLEQLDDTVHIEMFGNNSSMNVTQAAAVALFEFTKS